MSSKDKRIVLFSALLVLVAVNVFAFSAATGTGTSAGSVGEEFYSAAVGFSNGYVGKTLALGGLASAMFLLFKGAVLPAIGCAIASVGFGKLDAIAGTMGFVA